MKRGIRQLAADARIHQGRQQRAAGNAGLHDDAEREYAYGPAQGLPNTKVGTCAPGTLRRGEEGWLVRHQHEERLEAYFRLRELTGFSPQRDERRRSTQLHPAQPSYALSLETTAKLPVRLKANLLSQNKRLRTKQPQELNMKYKQKVLSHCLPILTAR